LKKDTTVPTDEKVDRRGFLKAAALGVTSLAVGNAACKGRGTVRDAGMDSGLSVDGVAFDGEPVDASPDKSARKPPNVLFILADQWRAQSLGFAGDPNAKTPNLDRLAAESVTFAHTVSCTPVCCPYRATLLTGRYPADTGVFLNDVNLAPDSNSLGERFKAAGYDTGYIGKWHLDGQGCRLAYTAPERRQGFTRWAAIECTHEYNNSAYYAGDDGSTRLTWQGYDAIAQTRELQRWLTERDPATPFCYFLSWGPPHDPYDTAPSQFSSQFSADTIQLRPNVPTTLANEARSSLAGYYAHLAALDKCIDDLMGTLNQLGLADDTIVVFTSDHGDMHRSQGKIWKQQPWDESILVPFLLRYPAGLGRSPRTIPMRLNTPDIMPTLLGLTGLAVPPSLPGRDFSPVMRQERAPEDNSALIMCPVPFGNWDRSVGGKEYRGLRTARYTYVRDLAGPWLLYDNDQDPYQLDNVVNQPAYAQVEVVLERQLSDKLAAIGDQFQPGEWYINQWGFKVDLNSTMPYVPYTYDC
jgi:arylsulfatase A-like enzyme